MRVLVTGATWNSGVAVCRSLREAGHVVVGVDRRRLPWNWHSRYMDACHCVEAESEEEYLEGLCRVLREEAIDVLMPYREMDIITRHKARLAREVRLLVPDHEAYLQAYDNGNTLRLCARLGVGCPALLSYDEAAELLRAGDAGGQPVRVVAKPRLDVGAAQGVAMLDSVAALEAYCRGVGTYGEVLFQEYIPGPVDNMFTIVVLALRPGELAASFTTHKLQAWPTSGGISALSESELQPALLPFVSPFFEATGWEGIAEAEIKRDARDGSLKLIEINPRFCGYMSFPSRCGINFPDLICRFLERGQLPVAPRIQEGLHYVNWPAYLRAVAHDLAVGPDRRGALRRLRTQFPGAKITNGPGLADAPFTLAKVLVELRAMLGR